jgi:uncharacterized protein YbjT (DUF2867 family)
MESRTALLAGATGLVGSRCLERLLAAPDFARVRVLVRRPLEMQHPKLETTIVDFDRLREEDVQGDDVFLCLGTTIKVAGSQEAFRKVDQHYTVAVAKLARKSGAIRVGLVSSVGANAKAKNFYLRVKGETEEELIALGYPSVAIMQPSLLLGERKEKRAGEGFATAASHVVKGLMIGGLRVYRPIEGDTVAAAMIAAVRRGEPGVQRYTFDAITKTAEI